MLAPAFREQPAVALYALTVLAIKVRAAAARRTTSDPSVAEAYCELAGRIATCHTQLLETLSEARRFQLLSTREVEESFSEAVAADLTDFFFPEWMHKFFLQRWRGELLGALMSGEGCAGWGGRSQLSLTRRVELGVLVAFVVLPLNVLALATVLAVAPQMEPSIAARLERLGIMGEQTGVYRPSGYCSRYGIWYTSFNMLRVPNFKFMVAHALNVSFGYLLAGRRLGGPGDWASDMGLNSVITVWAIALLVCTCWRLAEREPPSFDIFAMLTASILAVVACLLGRQDVPGVHAPSVASLAMLPLALNTAIAMLRMSQAFGPLVRIAFLMLYDMSGWFVLWFSILLCFWLAVAMASADPPDLLLWNYARLGAMTVGIEEVVGEQPSSAVQNGLLYGYAIITGNMLVPLLGAIMFERYAAIWPDKLRYFYAEFAKIVLRNVRRPLVPPPLRVLTLPAVVGCCMLQGTEAQRELEEASKRPHAAQRAAQSTRPNAGAATHRSAEPTAAERAPGWHEAEYLQRWTASRVLQLIDSTAQKQGGEADASADGAGAADACGIVDNAGSGGGGGSSTVGDVRSLVRPFSTRSDRIDTVESKRSTAGRIFMTDSDGRPTLINYRRKKVQEVRKSRAKALKLLGASEDEVPAEEEETEEDSDEDDEEEEDEETATQMRALAARVKLHDGFIERIARIVFPYTDKFANREQGALGSKWKPVGTQKPTKGNEITCDALAAILAKVDKNKDGRISVDERRHADRNRDGKLSLSELSISQEQLDAFAIKDLKIDSFIKVGDEYFEQAAQQSVRQMTILANGTVENAPKKLWLSGDAQQAERALCFFPFAQSMSADHAAEHINRDPNRNFVWERDDGTYAVAHCWPIKYNAKWKQDFVYSEGKNPDITTFDPRAVAEIQTAMVKLFGVKAERVPFVYGRQEKMNAMPVLIGRPEDVIAYLRSHPRLSNALGILKLLPSGFIGRIVDGAGLVRYKTVAMATGPHTDPVVVYVKQGWESMPMTKPLSLFSEDCVLGRGGSPSANGPSRRLQSALHKLDELNTDLQSKIEKRRSAAADGAKGRPAQEAHGATAC